MLRVNVVRWHRDARWYFLVCGCSSRPEGGDDGGDVSTLRRLTVAVVVRDLRSVGGGLASHGKVRGIWACGLCLVKGEK